MSGRNTGNSMVFNWGRSMVFLLAAAVLVVSLVMVSMNSSLRVRLDATKTRAYSLSPRTTALLEHLEGIPRQCVGALPPVSCVCARARACVRA